MTKTKLLVVLGSIVVVIIGGFFLFQKTEQVPQNSPTSITLQTKLSEPSSGLGVTITPTSVVSDSRCPQGVQCIWAGTVSIVATIKSAMGEAPMTLTLNTPITTEAEKITLVSVTPEAVAGTKIELSDYVFTFLIEKR